MCLGCTSRDKKLKLVQADKISVLYCYGFKHRYGFISHRFFFIIVASLISYQARKAFYFIAYGRKLSPVGRPEGFSPMLLTISISLFNVSVDCGCLTKVEYLSRSSHCVNRVVFLLKAPLKNSVSGSNTASFIK